MAKKLEEGDEERGRYLETLKNGSRFRGYVGFDRQRAEKPIAEYLGLDKDGFLYLMIDHLESGGRLDRVDETRPEWNCHKFHFDLWPEVEAGMEQKNKKGKQVMADKPYPWTCGQCAQKTIEPVVKDYQIAFKHDGKVHQITLPQIEVPTCRNCGTEQTDIQISRQVTSELRRKIGLMFPDEIRQQRTALGLNQEQLGECIGAAKESISRWETGALIQSVSTDKLLRMFFKHPTDPVWKNRWTSVESTPADLDPSGVATTWKATLSQAYATSFVPTDYFHELRDSIERLLLSRLMVEDSKLPEVESRLSEEDFQDTVLRRAYSSMKSAYHESRKIVPRRFTELLASQISELPIEPRDVVIFLVDTAAPNTNIDELVTLMSRRSQIRRELNESL